MPRQLFSVMKTFMHRVLESIVRGSFPDLSKFYTYLLLRLKKCKSYLSFRYFLKNLTGAIKFKRDIHRGICMVRSLLSFFPSLFSIEDIVWLSSLPKSAQHRPLKLCVTIPKTNYIFFSFTIHQFIFYVTFWTCVLQLHTFFIKTRVGLVFFFNISSAAFLPTFAFIIPLVQ